MDPEDKVGWVGDFAKVSTSVIGYVGESGEFYQRRAYVIECEMSTRKMGFEGLFISFEDMEQLVKGVEAIKEKEGIG